ncbi:MAG: glycosyltransferase, partial [Planctomycetes bacterium]|nr:glycosyltransferase [Planctomycetota bacterium]
MSGLILFWLATLGLVVLVWLSRHAAINRAHRTHRELGSRSHEGPPADAPRLSVLVAAKDEEDTIEACVTSFCSQDYPDYQVIVIDDRSTDRTPKLLADLCRRYPDKLRVVTVRALREGWFGKNNAMREGVAVADGQWLCFADADCRQTSEKTLSMAMSEAAAGGTDFLSVLPVLETHTFWERIIQPVCAAVMTFWYHPDKVNDPNSTVAYANGAFMLLKRSVYDDLGGHERVRTEVNEDMHLARLAKAAGHRLQVIANDDLYVTRMYTTFSQSWRGWSRIFYGCLGSVGRVLAAIGILTLFSILPWASLVASLIGWFTADTGDSSVWGWMLLASGSTVLLQQSVMFRFYRIVRAEPAWSFGYILGACLCWGMLVNALFKMGGATRTTWRGTTYRGARV